MSDPLLTTLDDVSEFIVDCLHATAPTEDDGYPLIRTPNIGYGRFDLAGVQRVSQATYETWTQRAGPQPGDLILAREAPAGNVAIVLEGQQLCLGQRTVHKRPDRTKSAGRHARRATFPRMCTTRYFAYFWISPHPAVEEA